MIVRQKLKHALASCLGAALGVAYLMGPASVQPGMAQELPASSFTESAPVKCSRLPSGLTVVQQRIPGCAGIGIALLVPAGADRDPQQRSGMAHLAEHLVYRATPAYSAGKSAVEWEKLGARRGALTAADYVLFWDFVPASAGSQALEMAADRFQGLEVNAESLKQEKVLLADELQNLQRNSWRSIKAQARRALPASAVAAGSMPEGLAEDIAKISETEAREFYSRYYQLDRAVLAVAGGFNEEALDAKIQQLFASAPAGSLPCSPEVPAEKRPRAEAVNQDIIVGQGTELPGAVLWMIAPEQRDLPIYALTEALNWRGSASRWGRMIKEAGWQDKVTLLEPDCQGNYALWAVGVSEQVSPQEVRALLQDAWQASVDTIPSYPELEAARKRTLANFYKRWQEPSQRAQMLAKAQYRGNLRQLIDFPRQVRSFTPQQIGAYNKRLALHTAKAIYVSELGGPQPRTYGPRPDEAFVSEPIERCVTTNGLHLAASPDIQQPMVYLRGYIEGGSLCDPPGRPGLTCFAAGLLSKGTDPLSGRLYSEELSERGMTLSFKCDRQYILVSGSCLREDVHRFLDILCSALRYSEPDGDSVEKWREQLVTELRQRENSAEDRAAALLMEKLYPSGHVLGRFYGGNSAAAASYTRDEALQHLRGCIYPARVGLCFSGGLRSEIVFAKIRSRLGDWSNPACSGPFTVPEAPRTQKGKRWVIQQDGGELMLIAQLGPGRQDPDYDAFSLLNQILASNAHLSRLPLRVTHIEHLGNGVTSRILPSLGPSPWIAAMRLHSGKSERALAIVKQEMARLVEPGPSEEEIERAKVALENQMLLQAASPAAKARMLCTADYYGLDDKYVNDVPSIYRDITPLQLHVVAKKWFDPMRLTVVISTDSR
ncbi:MAG: insulinase family protein [bacterium]|nr:insulinase family protein [bacterium]